MYVGRLLRTALVLPLLCCAWCCIPARAGTIVLETSRRILFRNRGALNRLNA